MAKELVVGALALALTAALCASFSSCASAEDGTPPPGKGEGVLDFDDASHAALINDERVIALVATHTRD